jgi:CDP-glycerol glycerophosphotransferase (TagB/SpsB family)
VPSLRAAFYVQGSPANQTMQRYRQLTHVWLNHGDSDKQANFHPRHATYDKLFVSGQQGVERYAQHGIEVPRDKFVIVGRPQIETIETQDAPPAPEAPRTVLYAPTWRGGRPSTNYSSLPVGLDIVRALIERGATVVFRPHPVSYENREDAARIHTIQQLLEADRTASASAPGPRREHVWGRVAEKDWDVPACFNASDALVTDVSSIASDYLASGKPFAMVAMLSGGADFPREFPMARVAYVIEKDLTTLPSVLDHLLSDDTMREARLAYREFCLGPSVGPGAAGEFLRIAGDLVTGRS